MKDVTMWYIILILHCYSCYSKNRHKTVKAHAKDASATYKRLVSYMQRAQKIYLGNEHLGFSVLVLLINRFYYKVSKILLLYLKKICANKDLIRLNKAMDRKHA